MNAMRPTRQINKFAASAVTMALVATVLAWPAPARAEDDTVPLDTQVLRGLLEGLGLKRDGQAINYQERAPLVIPPGRTLPPPEKSDDVIAKNPAWPNDPDVARRKAEAKLQRNRNISEEREREQNPLPPDQMTPGPGRKRQPMRDDGYQPPATGFGNPLSPSELGYKGNLFGSMFGGSKDEDVAKFTGEPPRTALTEPPPGYQTPSPDQPYGTGKEKPKEKTANQIWLDRAAGENR